MSLRRRSVSSPTQGTPSRGWNSTASTPDSRSGAPSSPHRRWPWSRSTTRPSATSELQWPFPRSLHARLIDRLREDGAKAIAYDVQFTEPTVPSEDNALIQAVDRAGNVVLATTEVKRDGHSNVFGGDGAFAPSVRGRATRWSARTPAGWFVASPTRSTGSGGFAVAAAEIAIGRPVGSDGFDSDGAVDRLRRARPRRSPRTPSPTCCAGNVQARQLARTRSSSSGPLRPSLQDVHRRPRPAAGSCRARRCRRTLPPACSTTSRCGPRRRRRPRPDRPARSARRRLAGYYLRPIAAFGVALAVGVLYLAVAQIAFDAGLVLPVVYPLLALIGRRPSGPWRVHYLRSLRSSASGCASRFARFVPEDGRRRGPRAARRRAAPRRRPARGHGPVQRPARLHVLLRDAASPPRSIEVLNRYLTRDDRRDPGPRRHARRLHGRRHHGRLRRPDRAARPRRPRARGRARDADVRLDALQRVDARRAASATASGWASGSTAAR